MTRTVSDLADAVVRHEGMLPTDEQVRAQSATVDLGRWRARWPQQVPLPAVLADVDPAAAGAGERVPLDVSRGDLLARGAQVTTEAEALDLYIRLAGWGGEALDLSPSRSRKIAADPRTPGALLRSAELSRTDPVAAYDSLWRGENKVTRFGPTAFTAWLYVCGYEAIPHGPAPLLLDHRVAAALGWSGARVSAAAYGRYLALAHETARLLTDRLGREVSPHAVPEVLLAVAG